MPPVCHVCLDQRRADFVRHEPSCFDRTETHVAPDLARAHSLFAGQHQVSDLEPVAERLVRVLKDRAGNDRKPIAVRGALLALPMPLARRQVIDGGIAATRAVNAIGPAAGLQICLAGILIADWKQLVELGRSQLMDGLWNPFRDHRTIIRRMGRAQRNPPPCGDRRNEAMGFTSFNPSYWLKCRR